MTPPTGAQLKTAIVNALPARYKHAGQPGEQGITENLDSYLAHVCNHISNAWSVWQSLVRYYGAVVTGSGLVAWNGTGVIGNFSTQIALSIPAFYGTEEETALTTSIQNRFKAAFNEWVRSFQFGGAPSMADAQFEGNSTATNNNPGTFTAELIPRLLTQHGVITLMGRLRQDIESDLTTAGFQLANSWTGDLTAALDTALRAQFQSWRGNTYVRNNMVTGTAAAATGSGSGTSGSDGEVT